MSCDLSDHADIRDGPQISDSMLRWEQVSAAVDCDLPLPLLQHPKLRCDCEALAPNVGAMRLWRSTDYELDRAPRRLTSNMFVTAESKILPPGIPLADQKGIPIKVRIWKFGSSA